jgi:hypothetical protein
MIESAFRYIEKVSCVQFVERKVQLNYIVIVDGDGCSSNVGKQGGRQFVTLTNSNLKYNCMLRGTIVHELLHAIGFWHMQSSSDRDEFVNIHYENIMEDSKSNYAKYDSTRFGTEYDIRSIMHYGAFYFSKNNKPTMEPKDIKVPLKTMGQREEMTSGDIRRLNMMYQCEV